MNETKNGIYAASRASLPARPAMWRALRALGYPIVSSWVDEDGPGQTASMAELWSRIVREIRGAKALALYAEPSDLPLKGAYVEAGIALAFGKPITVTMPGSTFEERRKLLGSWVEHPSVKHCETVEEAMDYIAGLPERSTRGPSLNSIYVVTEALLCNGSFREMDNVLNGFDELEMDHMSDEEMIAWLIGTLAAKDILKRRASFVGRVVSELSLRHGQSEVDKLVQGLT
jgi:hypothetical protein